MAASTRRPSRRQFLKQVAQGSAVCLAPQVIPGSALGLSASVAPSERITMAGIGLRYRGVFDLECFLPHRDVQFLAICDVLAVQREVVKRVIDNHNGNRDCTTYCDLRDLLARQEIDAVLIATGDRWHTAASILAAKAGKDVYSEKPVCITIGQCQALADAFRRYGRVFQAGTQRRSIPHYRLAVDLARRGKLGKLHTVHAAIHQTPRTRYDWLPAQPEPDREVCDWDLWLGPAPWRPYNAEYIAGGWRQHHDLDSGGTLHDWGTHTVDLCQWANNADGTSPIEFEPVGSRIVGHYANGVKIVLRADGWLPLGMCPVRFEGDEGWVETGDSGKIEVYPNSLRNELKDFTEDGISPARHIREFLDCVKSRATTICNADVTRSSHVACHAAATAWRLGRKVKFDPGKEEFIGDEEANRSRHRAAREPWNV